MTRPGAAGAGGRGAARLCRRRGRCRSGTCGGGDANARPARAEAVTAARRRLEAEQFARPWLAWLATYVEALQQMHALGTTVWTREAGLGEIESLILQAAFGEYLAQMAGGIADEPDARSCGPPISGVDARRLAAVSGRRSVARLIARRYCADIRAGIAELHRHMADAIVFGDPGLDETHAAWSATSSAASAQERGRALRPSLASGGPADPAAVVIAEMAELGVFGLTIPEEYGGLGLGKIAMCVVTEELSARPISASARSAPARRSRPN